MNYYPCNSGQPSAGGSSQFTGTIEEWNALSAQEKAMYDGGDWTNDFNGSPVDSAMSATSERPLQNKVITQELNKTYKSTDSIETTIDSADYLPFYDVSSGTTKRIAVADADFGGGSGGHVIEDASGTTFTQRSILKVENAYVEDDAVNDATILRSTNFTGTRAQWNALSAAEQAKYTSQDITDEYGEYPIDPTPTQNSTNPVASGGVYSGLASKVNTSDVVNNVTTTTSGKVLDARQGKALNDVIVKCITDVIEVTTPSFSSLPQTYTVSGLTADHTLIQDGYALLSTPSAQGSDWTITTAANSVTISGTFSGTTATTVKMTLGVKRSVTAT